MQHFRKWLAVLLAAVLMLTVAGCGGDAKEGDKGASKEPEADKTAQTVKVGWVYIGVPGDAGWTYIHDQGRQYMEQALADKIKVESKILEQVPEGADAERSIEQLVQEGCQIIFANSFGYGDGVLSVAKKYPDVVFMHCSGLQTAENVGTYFGRIYQVRYLTGIIAGKMTESNKIGYVAAVPIPEVIRGINAFTLGARSVNPEARVQVVWTNTWFDPAKEKDAAKSLLETGCDVLAQHQDTPSVQQAAEEAGKFAIGYHSDMHALAPKANLTSAIWNWGPFYVKTVEEVVGKTWKSSNYWGGLGDGIVELAPISEQVPAEVVQLVEAAQSKLEKGEADVFVGPINDQNGEERVKSGEALDDAAMLSMNWFVEGVDGKIQN